jgi:hypothetical protein
MVATSDINLGHMTQYKWLDYMQKMAILCNILDLEKECVSGHDTIPLLSLQSIWMCFEEVL